MARQDNRTKAPGIVVESALTRKMYAWILLMLGIRSWGFVLLAAVLGFLAWTAATTGTYTLLIIYVCLLVGVYGGAVLVSVVSRKNRRAYAPVKYTFEESAVFKESANTSQTLRWDAFVRWRKIGAYYLIYQNKRSFFVVPKARIPEGRADRFESLLARKVVRKRTSRFAGSSVRRE